MTNKQLAEKAIKWLGAEWELFAFRFDVEVEYENKEWVFFSGPFYPANLMHHGKREMWERGFLWEASYGYHSFQSITYFYKFFKTVDEDNDTTGIGEDDNEMTAFWKAVEATGVLDDNE